METAYLHNEFSFCMHSCGLIHGLIFTNSLEAVEYWYERGVRIFEADVDRTWDDEFVACHDFVKETFQKMEIEEIPEQCTCGWFLNQKLYKKSTGGLTPMSLEDIIKLLQRYPDSLFMIDPKVYSYRETCLLLDKIKYYIETLGIDGKRIIFETYNEEMIQALQNYKGLLQYQYCVDDERETESTDKIRKWELGKLIRFLKENDIGILSYPWKYAVEELEKLKQLKEEGFFIFSRTKNDIFSDLLKKAGIDVNIIDSLVTEAQREELKAYRDGYLEQYGILVENIFGDQNFTGESLK